MRWSNRLIFLLLGALPLAGEAALPQRTLVASNGIDTNPCTLIAPCRSFGAAISAVADGGEVIVLDSAGYGAVTIKRSVSIVAPPGVYAGVSVFGSAGVTVDGAVINVVLRGLTINYQGGSDGIDFLQGASLHVENCVISGFTTGTGILVSAVGGVTHVLDTIVRDGQNGIVFGSGGVANLSRVRVERNLMEGIEVLDNAIVSIEDSVVAGNMYNIDIYPLTPGATPYVTVARTLVAGGNYGIVAAPYATFAVAHVTVMDSTISNAGVGIYAAQIIGTPIVAATRNQLQGNVTALFAEGPAARLILDGNTVTGNTTGVSRAPGATIATRGNNTVHSNGTDTVGTPYTSLLGI